LTNVRTIAAGAEHNLVDALVHRELMMNIDRLSEGLRCFSATVLVVISYVIVLAWIDFGMGHPGSLLGNPFVLLSAAAILMLVCFVTSFLIEKPARHGEIVKHTARAANRGALGI
jgi:hypothetical protein